MADHFKRFMLDVWRPAQQKAIATGRSPADMDVSGAMRSYITPRVSAEVRGQVGEMEQGLAERGLGLRKRSLGLKRGALDIGRKQLEKGKQLAPWATGLGVANVALSGLQGWQEQETAKRDRQLMQQYIAEIKGMRSE